MKAFLSKRIKLFGRSVPLTVLLALLVVGVAVAAFSTLIVQGQISGSASPAVSVTFDHVSCAISGGGICSGTDDGANGFVLSFDSVTNSTSLEYDVYYHNNEAENACIKDIGTVVIPGSDGHDLSMTRSAGAQLPPGGTDRVKLSVDGFSAAQAGETWSLPSFDLQFDRASEMPGGVCP